MQVCTEDGMSFDLDTRMVSMCMLFLRIMQLEGEESRPRLVLPGFISTRVIQIVLAWLQKRLDKLEDTQRVGYGSADMTAWHGMFFSSQSVDELSLVLLAANYLEIPDLIDILCRVLAERIRDRSPEDIRKIAGITNDFSPELNIQIHKELQWSQM